MPALTFMQRTTQSSQNWGVFQATSTATLAFVTRAFTCSRGTQPSGFQPSGGTRTMNAPKTMETEYSAAMTSSASCAPTEVSDEKRLISSSASGPPISAPPPNPMMAMPVAMPGRSGNHFIKVDTGEM